MLTQSPAIFTHFQNLTDPRQEAKVIHSLTEMITIAMCASICGANSWSDVETFAIAKYDWLCNFLKLEHGIPSHDTFNRVFSRLDTQEMHESLQCWIASLELCMKDQGVHIDGKTLRRSFDKSSDTSALQVVSAWASDLSLCLGQVAVDENSNEITAVPQLLELLEITGAVVTLDAMHCQTKTAAKIREKKADYILTVKGNQTTLRNSISELFVEHGEEGYCNKNVRVCKTIEESHGRTEMRVCTVAPAPKEFAKQGWTDVKSVGMLYRERTVNGKTSEQLIYFISSLPPKVRKIAKHLRSHWSVENQLHWSLDVNFSEDASRIRKGNGQEVASIFRRLSLSLIKQNTSIKASQRRKRLLAGWDTDQLEKILTGK